MASSAPLARRRAPFATDGWRLVALAGLTLLTRLWIPGPSEGEPDSALFSLGAWQWVHHGAHAARVYDRWFSSGYYAFCGELLRALHAPLAQVTSVLDNVSLAAALVTVVMVWMLGRRLLPASAAFWATVLFVLCPGIWQLGAEPHPEGLGIALLLVAWYATLRCGQSQPTAIAGLSASHTPSSLLRSPRRVRDFAAWWLAATVVLAAALLVRGDAVLMFPAFLAVWLLPGLDLDTAARRRAAAASLATLIAASLVFLAVRAALLGQSVGHTQHHAWSKVAGYLGHLSWLHQLLPNITALGPAAWIFTAAGLVLLVRACNASAVRRWVLFALAWSAPGWIFWFLVRGNNVRHVAIYALPWLWIACLGWHQASRAARLRSGSRRRWPVLAAMAILALLVDATIIPANSNLTLYPSGNVPASFALLRHREQQMRGLARYLLAQAHRQPGTPVCYLGATTSPYVLLYSLEAAGQQGLAWRLAAAGPVTTLSLPGFAPVVFHDVYSPAQFRAARAACSRAFSLEYNAAAGHLWFFGAEWRHLPFHARWYAGRVPLR